MEQASFVLPDTANNGGNMRVSVSQRGGFLNISSSNNPLDPNHDRWVVTLECHEGVARILINAVVDGLLVEDVTEIIALQRWIKTRRMTNEEALSADRMVE